MFEDVYDQCIKDPWQDKEMFRNHVLGSFFQANNKLIQDDIGSEAFHEFLKKQGYSSDQRDAVDRERKCHESLLLPVMNYNEQKNQNPKCIKDTGRWALDHFNYTQWRDIGEKKLLWILADPGYGKSVLCRTIVDDDLPTHTTNTSVIHFFFKDTNDDQRSARAALLSLMYQLTSQRPSLVKHALPLCDKAYSADAEFQTFWSSFLNMIQDPQTGDVICVLDALDECKLAWCGDLISSIGHSNSTEEQAPVSNLRFLVTSRPYLDLKHAIGETAHKSMVISLDGEMLSELEREVESVIKQRVAELDLQQKFPNEVREYLERTLTEMKNRTYLWLRLVFDCLPKSWPSTVSEMEELIATLPKGIDEAYESLLNKCGDPN